MKQLTIEHPENKGLCSLGCLKTRSNLDCISPKFDKQSRCKITKTTKATDYVSILSLLFGVLTGHVVNTGQEYARSNLISKISNDFIFGMLYCLRYHFEHLRQVCQRLNTDSVKLFHFGCGSKYNIADQLLDQSCTFKALPKSYLTSVR